MEHPFTIAFNVTIKKSSYSSAATRKEKIHLTPDSVTYEGLIADLKSFGYLSNRMWYFAPGKRRNWCTEIKSDEQVKEMAQLASKKGLVDIQVEAQVDSDWEGKYDHDNTTITRSAGPWIEMYAHEDAAESDISSPDEDSDSATVGESKADGTISIDDFHSELGNAECFEAMGNRRQIRDGRIGNYDSVDRGITTSMDNRNSDKGEIGESADQNDVVWSSCQWCGGVEHHEKSCNATPEVEDHKDLSSVKRDRTAENGQAPAKTGRGSATGRDPTERGRGRDMVSSSRNDKELRLGRDAAYTLGKGKASNSRRDIASSSRSSTTSSSIRAGGSTSEKGPTLSSRRGMTLSLGTGRGSSSRVDTTKMGIASSPGRGITSSSKSSATLSIGRGRASTSGKGTTVTSGRGTTLNLGRGTTNMGARLRSRTNKGSSLATAEPQTSR